MCYEVPCTGCGNATFAGCGRHVDAVRRWKGVGTGHNTTRRGREWVEALCILGLRPVSSASPIDRVRRADNNHAMNWRLILLHCCYVILAQVKDEVAKAGRQWCTCEGEKDKGKAPPKPPSSSSSSSSSGAAAATPPSTTSSSSSSSNDGAGAGGGTSCAIH